MMDFLMPAFRATDEDDEPNKTFEDHLGRIGCSISYHDLIM